ncbi:NmrA family NAD(P)-binding protein [Dyella sp.]|uniref:NmrA family NAD(P)-binding protein n=1 Tax=Dyella sp. TaxID=1869338 RepID=UPI0032165465
MHIILGGTGHVGSAAAKRLLEMGEPVTVVSHTGSQRYEWERRGARFEVADVFDTKALRDVFRTGKRAFLLNPPADPSTDTDAQEKRSAAAILDALDGSGLEQVVAESTMGAQPGERLGDLSVLYDFEKALRRQPVPVAVIRAAYYMSNWDASLEMAINEGHLASMYPADLAMPMVAPEDLGRAAARLLTAPRGESGIHYVEGPERYSPNDVAAAFAAAIGKPVAVKVIPRDQWEATYRKLGFSKAAAASYARMTAVSLDGDFERPASPERGTVTLQDYIDELVGRAARQSARTAGSHHP